MDFDWPDDYTVEKRIGIATTQPSEALDVIGNISATGDISATNLNLNGSLTINQNLTVSGNFQLGTLSVKEFSSDGNLADNSNLAVPTEQAVKTYVDNQINTRAALNGAADEDFATNNLSVDESLTVSNAIATKQLSVSDAVKGSLTVENDLTVNNAIATRQLSVSDAVTGSLTVENDLTVNNAIATRQLNVTDQVTDSLKIENNLLLGGKVGIGTTNLSQALEMGGRGKNIRFEYTHIGETIGGAATIIANKARVSETENNRVDYSLDGPDGVSAIELLYTNGISFFTKDNSNPTVEGDQFFSIEDGDRTYERMRISSTGNVGIGTMNPRAKLEVSGRLRISEGSQSNFGGHLYLSKQDGQRGRGQWHINIAPNNALNFVESGIADYRLVIKHGGNIGIGTSNPLHLLHLEGGANCDGRRWRDASSVEYKQDVKQLTLNQALETLTELNPVTFRYKGEKSKQQVGFIAEEVPELVASNDRKGLSPMDIIGILTKIVQHQQIEIDELKARLNKSL